jgi:hypothetical protein
LHRLTLFFVFQSSAYCLGEVSRLATVKFEKPVDLPLSHEIGLSSSGKGTIRNRVWSDLKDLARPREHQPETQRFLEDRIQVLGSFQYSAVFFLLNTST